MNFGEGNNVLEGLGGSSESKDKRRRESASALGGRLSNTEKTEITDGPGGKHGAERNPYDQQKG